MSDANEHNNCPRTQAEDEDDLSSAGIIQKAISDYEQQSKKSTLALPPTDEISFFPSTTPVADSYRRTSSNILTVKPATVASSSAKWNSNRGSFE